MPQILKNKLHKLDHSFFSKSDYTIRTIAQGLNIHPKKDEQEFSIFSKKFILKRNNKYNFLHMGSL